MAELYGVIIDLIQKRRDGVATLADYLHAIKVVIAFIDQVLNTDTPVIGDAPAADIIAAAEQLSIETTGESLRVPSEGGSLLPILIAILKLLASAS